MTSEPFKKSKKKIGYVAIVHIYFFLFKRPAKTKLFPAKLHAV